jgi:REDY-like protein HapK
MAQRVFFLNTLRDEADPVAYEQWIRDVDYPVARAQDAIRRYEVTRLEGMLQGDGEPEHDYLEVIEITDIDAYRAGMEGNAEFEQLLEEWSGYVAESVMVYGEVIE